MPKPLILITIGTRNDVSPYAQAVSRAGGVPIVGYAGDAGFEVPESIAGVVLAGGASVEPARYGENYDTTIPKSADLPRDAMEWAVLDYAMENRLPVLGVCRGLQVLNVYFGGSLHQFLPKTDFDDDHRPDAERAYLAHTVRTEPGRLSELLGSGDVQVNSIHRQGINRLAEGLQATVFSPDGLIEGVEGRDGQIIAVQWHPEELAATDPGSHALFADVVERSSSGLPSAATSLL